MKKGIITQIGILIILCTGCKDDKSEPLLECEHECVSEELCVEPNIPHDDMACEGEGMVCCELVPLDSESGSGSGGTGEDTESEQSSESPEDTGTGTETTPPDSATESAPEDTGDGTGMETDSNTEGEDTATGSAEDTGTGYNSGLTCAEAILVTPLPFTHSGSTASSGNDYSVDACDGITSAKGGGSNDVVYVFTPPATAIYNITVDGFDTVPYIVTDCDAIDDSCLIATDDALTGMETLVVELQADQDYYIIVDGWNDSQNIAGAYTLEVSAPCTPSCDGKACGDDGCGQSCGVCDPGYTCDQEGQCRTDDTIGNSCTYPHPVTELPFTHSGTTETLQNLYGAKDGDCPGISRDIGQGSNDAAYEFTPEVAGRYTITTDGDFDHTIYIVTDCSLVGSTCVAGVDTTGPAETLTVDLRNGVTYFIVIDGWDAADNVSGTYTLTLSEVCVPDCDTENCGDDGCGGICGECAETEVCGEDQVCETYSGHGDSCADPFVVNGAALTAEDGVLYTKSSSTILPTNEFGFNDGACGALNRNGLSSDDEVYAFTPAVSGVYTLRVAGDFDAMLYVATACDDIDGTCIAEESGVTGPNPEELSVQLAADTTYYVIVDGDHTSSNIEGTYTLTIFEPCIPQCDGRMCGPDQCGFECGDGCESAFYCDDGGLCQPYNEHGDSCLNPFVVPGSLPYSDIGDTTSMHPVYDVAEDQCPGATTDWGTASDDVVYSFTPEETGVYTIAASSDEFDSALYVARDCDLESACVGAARSAGRNTSLTLSLEGGAEYAVVLDGVSTGSNFNGAYTFSISAPCFSQCDGRACGDDGCGLPCGECPDDQFCDLDGQCSSYSGVGDICNDPILIDTMPFANAGDTSLADDHYEFDYDECPGLIYGGHEAEEEIYALTVPFREVYTISVTSEFEAAVYVVTDCSEIGTTCQQAMVTDPGVASALELILEPDIEYYIIVDGWGAQSGPYTLSVSSTCTPDCGGKACGDDGCGFSCGGCGSEEYCDTAQQCAVYDFRGDSCANPIALDGDTTFPVTADSSSASFHNVHSAASGDCPGLSAAGAEANDVVYSFTPPASGYYTISTDDVFNNAIYVVTDCGDIAGTCLGGSNEAWEGSSVEVLMDSAVTYYIIVDGSSNQSGAFELTISGFCAPQCDGMSCGDDSCGHEFGCGACRAGEYCDDTTFACEMYDDIEGDSCFNPVVIPSNWTTTWTDETVRDTTDLNNGYGLIDYNQCPGVGGLEVGHTSNELVYEFTPALSGYYTFTVDADFWGSVYITSDCLDIDNNCLGGTFDNYYPVEVRLRAGETYYIIVDGDTGTTAGTFTMTVDYCAPVCDECGDDGCGHPVACGGCGGTGYCDAGTCVPTDENADSCIDPEPIELLGVAESGYTDDLHSVFYIEPDDCNGVGSLRGAAAADVVYSLNVGFSDTYRFSLYTYGFDGVLYITSACGEVNELTCVGAVDETYGGETEVLDVFLSADHDYYVIIDGSNNEENPTGYYEITVDYAD